jgi:HAD superfamily hydrolase (TIGR01509 family)
MASPFLPEITYIYFDFDNVLAVRTQNRAQLVAALLGVPNASALRHYYTEGFRDDASLAQAYFAMRTVGEEVTFYAELFKQFTLMAGSTVQEEVAIAAARAFVEVPFTVNPQAAAALTALQHHYSLGILSNGRPSRDQEISDSNLRKYFKSIVMSYNYTSEKPDLTLYSEAVKLADVAAGQIALVDDEPANIAGAEAAGLGQGIIFTQAFWQTVLPAST